MQPTIGKHNVISYKQAQKEKRHRNASYQTVNRRITEIELHQRKATTAKGHMKTQKTIYLRQLDSRKQQKLPSLGKPLKAIGYL